MSDFFETYMLFRRVIFTTRKKEKYFKKCPDQPYLAVFQNDRKHVGRNLIQTLAAIFIL